MPGSGTRFWSAPMRQPAFAFEAGIDLVIRSRCQNPALEHFPCRLCPRSSPAAGATASCCPCQRGRSGSVTSRYSLSTGSGPAPLPGFRGSDGVPRIGSHREICGVGVERHGAREESCGIGQPPMHSPSPGQARRPTSSNLRRGTRAKPSASSSGIDRVPADRRRIFRPWVLNP